MARRMGRSQHWEQARVANLTSTAGRSSRVTVNGSGWPAPYPAGPTLRKEDTQHVRVSSGWIWHCSRALTDLTTSVCPDRCQA